MTNYEKLRELRNEENDILYREVSTADVLMMLGDDYVLGCNGIFRVKMGKLEFIDIFIDLSKPLSEQEEVCKNILELIN